MPTDDENPEELAQLHALRNRMAGLVVSLRALAADLDAAASNADDVRRVTDEYAVRLETIVRDLRAAAGTSIPNRCGQ